MVLRISLILLVLNFQISASKRIDIYLGFKDCISCFSALSVLGSLTDFEKNIIIYKGDSLVANEFLSRFDISEDVRYNYTNNELPGLSYCKIYDQNALTDSFGLIHLHEKARLLNTAENNKEPSRKFLLPPKLTLNKERLEISQYNQFVNIYDYILNKIVLLELDKHKDTIAKSVEIRGSQFNPRMFFKVSRIDSSLYFACYKTLKKIGKSEAHIEGVFLGDSVLNLLINFPYVYLDSKNPRDTGIGMGFFLYQRHLYTGEKKLIFINHNSIISKYSFRYAINNALPFFTKANQVYFSVSDFKKTDNSIKLFSTWNYDNKKEYEFSQLDKLSIDKADYSKYDYSDLNFMINSRFYFNATLKFIFDYKNSSIVTLQNLKINSETAYVSDLCQEKELLKILSLTNNGAEVIVYNLKTRQTISRADLKLPETCLLSTVRFSEFNLIEFMDKDCKYLYFLNTANQH
jgi:hypothetical protein